jgi:hypothetical protein
LNSQPLLESRPAWGTYFAPIVLTGGAVAMLIAWLILSLVGDNRPELGILGPPMALAGAMSLVLAAIWVWGARRGRVVITEDELTLIPPMGRPKSVMLTRLVTVDLRRLPLGSASRAMVLTDADGRTVQIGIGAWQREEEILRLVADAARRTTASLSPEAKDVIAHGGYWRAD